MVYPNVDLVAVAFTCDSSGCGPSTCSGPNLIDITQKRIWNTVRVPASEYVMNLGSFNCL